MNRVSKPFNPILGETFALEGENWKLLAEQVSHHPPISAVYVESDGYKLHMNTAMTTHFWGKSIEFKPIGAKNIEFMDNGDKFYIERPVSACKNILFGTMYIEHYGKMIIKNNRTGDECILEFHKAGKSMFGKSKNIGVVEGEVKDADGETHYYLQGRWNDHIAMSPKNPNKEGFDEENSTMLWEAYKLPEDSERMYHFTPFTLQLNKITNKLKETLPPTDCRLRTDQRALENGDLTLANQEKHRLEERQRAIRKKNERDGIEWTPSYFKEDTDPVTGLTEFKYINDYWEDKKNKNWSNMPDLFGYDEIL